MSGKYSPWTRVQLAHVEGFTLVIEQHICVPSVIACVTMPEQLTQRDYPQRRRRTAYAICERHVEQQTCGSGWKADVAVWSSPLVMEARQADDDGCGYGKRR